MLEKVIEEGIKQTTELQEIHHSEVEDLHKQVFTWVSAKFNYRLPVLSNSKIRVLFHIFCYIFEKKVLILCKIREYLLEKSYRLLMLRVSHSIFSSFR